MSIRKTADIQQRWEDLKKSIPQQPIPQKSIPRQSIPQQPISSSLRGQSISSDQGKPGIVGKMVQLLSPSKPPMLKQQLPVVSRSPSVYSSVMEESEDELSVNECYESDDTLSCGWPTNMDGSPDMRYKYPQILNDKGKRDEEYELTSVRRKRLLEEYEESDSGMEESDVYVSSEELSPCYSVSSDKECGFPVRQDGRRDRRYKSPQILRKDGKRHRGYPLTSERRNSYEDELSQSQQMVGGGRRSEQEKNKIAAANKAYKEEKKKIVNDFLRKIKEQTTDYKVSDEEKKQIDSALFEITYNSGVDTKNKARTLERIMRDNKITLDEINEINEMKYF